MIGLLLIVSAVLIAIVVVLVLISKGQTKKLHMAQADTRERYQSGGESRW